MQMVVIKNDKEQGEKVLLQWRKSGKVGEY